MIANLADSSALLSPAAPLPPFALGPMGAPRRERDLTKALQLARAATRSVHPRNCLRRLAYLLCELGSTLDESRRDRILLPREKLAEALGISLSKVKRTMALLSLSRVIGCEGQAIRVLDWRRLSATAGFDNERLGCAGDGEEADQVAPEPCELAAPQLVTANGDPAFFG